MLAKLGKTPTAALIAQEMKWHGDRSGMDYYYLTGIEEDGGALLLSPTAPTFKERLFLARHDIEEERTIGERAAIPSKALEVSTGIAAIGREQRLAGWLVRACSAYGSLTYVGEFNADGPKPKVMDYYAKTLDRVYGCKVNDLHLTLARMREVKEPEEIALMRKAIEYTAAGHARAISVIRAGVHEFDVKDAIEDAFRKRDRGTSRTTASSARVATARCSTTRKTIGR